MNALRKAVLLLLPALLAAQSPSLQIHVIEGEGAVHAAGSKTAAPLRVKVTDEFGQPVAGAVVSFRLPDSGPTGLFANALNTEVAITGADGSASSSSVRWNLVSGGLLVRITAVKEHSRAGTAVSQYLTDPSSRKQAAAGQGSREPAPPAISRSKRRIKWLVLGFAVATAASAGFVSGRAGKSVSGAAKPQGPVRIGMPTVTIGQP